MSRYVVVGAGAVGATLAAEFDSAGIDYVLVARGVSYRAIADDGLRYVRPSGERTIRLRVVDGPDAVTVTTADVLLLTVKAQQVEAAVAQWAWRSVEGSEDAVAQTIPIVTFQNGLDSERTALRRFSRVYGASIRIPGTHVEPGVVVSAGEPSVALNWLGCFPGGIDSTAQTIARDLGFAHIPTDVVPDIGQWKAAKLIDNLLNAVDLFRVHDADIAEIAAAVRSEAESVYAAAGIEVADYGRSALDLASLGVADIEGYSSTRRSTWQSVVRGSSVETDYLNGEIVLLGRLHGIATPVNEALAVAANSVAEPGSRDLRAILPHANAIPV
ncbi:hypothetical protein CH251_12265 [Rhodococcus sp. 06-462-5]|uniref:ketopantoate reductase family protein n=1 Tax=Nocardiaceae TaxID=85025 RepID=UPI00050C4894|nr:MULTISPECIES: 2-dehydropantoate 2-reductase N-terminal domain-containing protein [Rhodococcus]OZC73907.1 hypothetical protein CH251_12265 [Rhodococcus sp. 06-462-5]OZE67904.1 hypothetical protein CH270_09225 [Rhodococcus sp. 02-925g]OZF51091.1 hypothetical protein CH291_05755 [Rhodococcus sp. 14-1411-2a]